MKVQKTYPKPLTRRLFLRRAGSGLAVLGPSWPLMQEASGGAAQEGSIAVGFRKQLLVDDYVLAERLNVTWELGQVTKANDGKPIIVADKPWENPDLFRMGSVFREGGKFKMRYHMSDRSGGLFGYAESEDGLHWTKPSLGFCEYQGSKDNNITDFRGLTCYLDPHETDPAHKYKSAYGPAQPPYGACLAHSADGFHWTSYNDGKPVTGRAADTINQILWDEEAKVYRLYTRTDFGRGLYGGTLEEDRGTRDMVNPDVKASPTNWKTVREWHFDREGPWEYKRRQIYSLNGWIYEGVHFGLIWSHEWAGGVGEGLHDLYKRHERDIMNFYIVTTRGDKMWDLSWVYAERPYRFSEEQDAQVIGPRVMVGVPLIPRGPDGSFDKDWVEPSCNIVTWNDKHWIYYVGSKERHGLAGLLPTVPEGLHRWDCAIGLATLRLDGFVCLEAQDQPGIVLTKPFKLEGSKLEVNVDAKNGEVVVEVLDEAGQPIPGYSQRDAEVFKALDELRLRLSWKGQENLAVLRGKIIRLKFHLKNAKLYAFQVTH